MAEECRYLVQQHTPGHINVNKGLPSTIAPCQIAPRLKGYVAHVFREAFPWLKYRLYPTPEQAQALSDILYAACKLYNAARHYRRKRWRKSRHSVTYYEQAAMWREWRNEEPDDNSLRMLNMTAGQQVLRRLDRAFRAFYQGKRGYPRYKQVNRFNSVDYKPGDGAPVRERKLYVQNVGLIPVRWHRALPGGKVKSIILLHKPSGWYIYLQVELPEPEPGVHIMTRNGNLSRAVHDVSLGMFREMLAYKAIEAGCEIITVNPAYTSQACSGCGCIVSKELGVRGHFCPDCGLTLDKDVNAARNILSAGTRRSDANVDGCIRRSPRSSPL